MGTDMPTTLPTPCNAPSTYVSDMTGTCETLCALGYQGTSSTTGLENPAVVVNGHAISDTSMIGSTFTAPSDSVTRVRSVTYILSSSNSNVPTNRVYEVLFFDSAWTRVGSNGNVEPVTSLLLNQPSIMAQALRRVNTTANGNVIEFVMSPELELAAGNYFYVVRVLDMISPISSALSRHSQWNLGTLPVAVTGKLYYTTARLAGAWSAITGTIGMQRSVNYTCVPGSLSPTGATPSPTANPTTQAPTAPSLAPTWASSCVDPSTYVSDMTG